MEYTAQLSFALFVLGLAVGSFLNAVIYRLHEGRSIAEKHSICPRCKHRLAWYDLIPIASFFMLRGKCRYCKRPISWIYPLVELVTAFSFVVIYLSECGMWNVECGFRFNIPDSIFHILFQFTFVCFLILIFVYDFKHYLILDKVVLPAAVLALFYQGYQGNWGMAILGGALLAGFFWALYLVSRGRWIGFGDVKLGLFLGFLVSWPATLALFFIAYLSGAAVSLALLAMGGKKMRDRLPFGTFLTFAAFIAMLWGEEMVEWYLRYIGMR